jgi:hypothetical protein
MKESIQRKYYRYVVVLTCLIFLAACNGSNEGASTPTLVVADATVLEGDAGSTELLFVLSLSGAASNDVSVDYATTDDSATAGSDYLAINGSVIIPAGDTQATIHVTVSGDTAVELDETLILTLTNLSGSAIFSDSSAVGTIINDDVALAVPDISLASASVGEGDAGTLNLIFQVTLSASISADVIVDYATADSSAVAGEDYVATNGTLVIPSGTMSATILVQVIGDTNAESDESFTLNLSNPSANATLGSGSAVGTILDDDTLVNPTAGHPLNDTGVTSCGNALENGLACNDSALGTDQFPGQDAEYGRELTASNDNDGRAGFVFTKLDAAGVPLPDQSVGYGVTPWSCVRDETTGKTWEVKTSDGGLQDGGWHYRWYLNAEGGECASTPNCAINEFVAAVNAIALCGYNDWRKPERSELLSIVDYGGVGAAMIDEAFFPNTSEIAYWSATANASDGLFIVDFSNGSSMGVSYADSHAVRLVRGGE